MTGLDWLLDSDPAIRWQVLRGLVHAPDEVVAAERARVATEGWGARPLALQGEDGQLGGGACFPARRFNQRQDHISVKISRCYSSFAVQTLADTSPMTKASRPAATDISSDPIPTIPSDRRVLCA
jgi:hypothetical protein